MPTSFANYKSHMFRSVVTQVDGVYTDFSSVFDTSNHNIFRTNFCCALIYLVRFASHVKKRTCFGECPPFLIFVLRRIYAEYFTNGVVICLQGPPPQGGQLKFTIADTLERIKEEFNFLQAQYHT